MSECSITCSETANSWPEGIVSVRVTMNPYILAMASEEAYKQGMKPWEFINAAIWEKLGQPEHDDLMDFAAHLDIEEEDPKWKKRLKITARHEVQTAAVKAQRAHAAQAEQTPEAEGNGG